jgi:hypothetical protein
MIGTFKSDDYGNVHFQFDDGTWAVANWESFGSGQGGEYNPFDVEGNTKLESKEIVKLAYANTGRPPGRIRQPE